jgi:SAM-dependent methyltransferase
MMVSASRRQAPGQGNGELNPESRGGNTNMQPDAEPKDLYERYFELCHVPLEHRDRVWQAVTRYLKRYIPADAAVLELGAGYCPFINQVQAKEKYALDRHEVTKHHAAPNVRTFLQSCTDLSNLPQGYFDVVFASNLLEHLTLADAGTTLDQVRAILKPGGRIMLIQPNFAYAYRQYFDDVSHVQVYTHVSLADFLKINGFSIEVVKPRFLPFSMRGTRIPTFSWLVTLYLHLPIKPLGGQMLVIARR